MHALEELDQASSAAEASCLIYQMPRCRGGKMPSRKRRSNKRKATKDVGIPKFDLLKLWNEYYIRNVQHGMSVQCEKCNKWRLVKEYQEEYEVPEFFECSMWSLSDGEKGNCYIPQLEDDAEFTNERYTPGSLVWAKMRGHPRWPAMVEDDPNKLLYCKDLETDPQYHVVFFGKKVSRTWLAEGNIEPFSIPPSHEMPPRADLRRAIEDAVDAQKMKKGDRLMTFSFSTRYGKNRTRLETKNAKPTCTRLQTSMEDYTAGDLVWVERTGYPRFPGMVEKDPAQMRYCKDLDADAEYHIVFFDETASKSWIKGSYLKPFSMSSADEIPLGKMKKALQDAEKAMTMTKQERLMRFSFSVRNGKKRFHTESKESETNIDRTEDKKIPDDVQHDSGCSTIPKKRARKHILQGVAQQNLQPPGNSEERVVETGAQKLPDYGQHDSGCSTIPKKRRYKHKLQAVAQRNLQPPGNSEERVIETGDQKLPDHGQHDSCSAIVRKRKRTSNHKLEAVTKRNLQPEERVVEPETQFIGNHPPHEDCQPHICSGKAPQNNGTFKRLQRSDTEMNTQPPNEEMDPLAIDENNNNDEYLHGENSCSNISDLSTVVNISGSHSTIPVITLDSDSEDEVFSFEHRQYAEYLAKLYPSVIRLQYDIGIKY